MQDNIGGPGYKLEAVIDNTGGPGFAVDGVSDTPGGPLVPTP